MGDTPADDRPAPPIAVIVPAEAAGQRLDRVLALATTGLSRSRLQALIKAGAVCLDGETIGDPGHRVKPGERYEIAVPAPAPAEPIAEALPLVIVHEDEDLIVVDKPAGLVVHPAAGHESGTLVNALLAHCGASLSGIGGVRRPGIVHRLDKDTSGLLVVAKNDVAHQALSEQFKAHGADGRLDRRYLAVVWGEPPRRKGSIDAPLARSRTSRTRIEVTRADRGRRAVTHYEVLETFRDAQGRPLASLIEARLETGRTHQIRVHLGHIGHPVMGDPVYASGYRTSASRLGPDALAALGMLGRQALHATTLTFVHPKTGERMTFSSRPPRDMMRLVDGLRKATALQAHRMARTGATDLRKKRR